MISPVSFPTPFRFEPRSEMDRPPDARISSTPAYIAGHAVVNVVICRMGIFAQQHGRSHDLPRLAVAALRHVLGDPSLLQGAARSIREPFNGRDLLARSPGNRRHAGPDRLAIQMDGA